MTTKKHVELEGNRIKLVPPAMSLVAAVKSAVKESEGELGQYLPWVRSSLDAPDENMQQAINNFDAHEKELRFHILEKNNAGLIGTVGLLVRDLSVPFYEMGYWVRTSQVGNGYIAEAVGLLEEYAFRELGARRIEIRMAEGNVKSRAVAERAGYLQEAALVNERRLPSGALTNTLVFAKFGL